MAMALCNPCPIVRRSACLESDQAGTLPAEELGKLTAGQPELRNSRFDGDKTDTWITFFAKSTPITFNLFMYGLLRERFGQHST